MNMLCHLPSRVGLVNCACGGRSLLIFLSLSSLPVFKVPLVNFALPHLHLCIFHCLLLLLLSLSLYLGNLLVSRTLTLCGWRGATSNLWVRTEEKLLFYTFSSSFSLTLCLAIVTHGQRGRKRERVSSRLVTPLKPTRDPKKCPSCLLASPASEPCLSLLTGPVEVCPSEQTRVWFGPLSW